MDRCLRGRYLRRHGNRFPKRGESMKMRAAAFLAATAAIALITGPATATPGLGVTGTVVARADFADPVDIKFKLTEGNQEVIHAPNAQQTVMQSIVITPGGHTGWHSH